VLGPPVFDLAGSDWSPSVTDAQTDHEVGRFEGFQRLIDAERAGRERLAAPAPSSTGR
jgi:hypothetical protein